MTINYETLSEIIVKNQAELNMIPEDFNGVIYIEFGTRWSPAIVTRSYRNRVVARENSSVVARDNSSVEAWENSSVVARGNSQIVDRLNGGRINISGNARIVYMPKTITEYCDFYGLKHDKKTGRFFKCVHKVGDRYFADKDGSFEYVIGEKAIPDSFDNDPEEDCGHGIHVAYLDWVLDYGGRWSDIAIIEVEAKLDDIVVPNYAPGKVRCKEVTVIREVPLEECGLFGKILAKRKANG